MYRMVLAVATGLAGSIGLAAQQPAHLVSDSYRTEFELNATRIVAAADDMPANRYAFRPTTAQMSFAEVVVHVLEGNDDIGAVVGDTTAPARPSLTANDGKAALVARLKDTFEFCRRALARINDSRLADPLPDYGTRAQALFNTINHWSDHYSQMAIYLRLSGVLPPTARAARPAAPPPRADSTIHAGRTASPAPVTMHAHIWILGGEARDPDGSYHRSVHDYRPQNGTFLALKESSADVVYGIVDRRRVVQRKHPLVHTDVQ
ncbi:MAG TPA: DinB family protein [Gemmatimonadales bacterium]|nr:DinB family protein [Gemmatimonadales bacterium]